VQVQRTHSQLFQMFDGDVKPILGARGYKEMGLVERIHKEKIQYARGHQHVFKVLGCIPGVYKIKPDPNLTPVIHASRKGALKLLVVTSYEGRRCVNQTSRTNPLCQSHGHSCEKKWANQNLMLA